MSFKVALNEAVRAGISRLAARKPFVQKTYNMGWNPIYNWDKAMAIADAMEDEERIRKMRLGK